MRARDVLTLFNRLNVIVDGHFRFASGMHGGTYINKDALYPYSQETSRLCYEIAKRAFLLCDIDCVVGPEKGGIILSQWVGYHLTQKKRQHVLSVFAEKKMHASSVLQGASSPDYDFIFTRGYADCIAGKNVLIVEDVITTGGSIKKVVNLVRESGGNVSGVAAVCNRGNIYSENIGSPPIFFALLDISLSSWSAEVCPLCAQGMALNTQLGSSKEFVL